MKGLWSCLWMAVFAVVLGACTEDQPREGGQDVTPRGALVIEVLQLEGGKALMARQLLSAHQTLFATGKRFDLPPANAQL